LLPKVADELKESKGKLAVVETPAPTSTIPVGTDAEGPLFGQPASAGTSPSAPSQTKTRTLRISGEIPTEVWNRLGRTLLPKLKTGGELHFGIDASIQIDADNSNGLRQEIEQILRDLNLAEKVKVDLK
jgi:hypothetical protein